MGGDSGGGGRTGGAGGGGGETGVIVTDGVSISLFSEDEGWFPLGGKVSTGLYAPCALHIAISGAVGTTSSISSWLGGK